ncbi:hypothetical protein GCM10027073_65880 [Streptomyces chlorus]
MAVGRTVFAGWVFRARQAGFRVRKAALVGDDDQWGVVAGVQLREKRSGVRADVAEQHPHREGESVDDAPAELTTALCSFLRQVIR